MTNREVELLAIGAGPSNLALAVALEELGVDDLAEGSLVVERERSISWQQGLLMPWAKSQVSFVKDLVTLRNPRSRFSFLSYLHDVGRLDDFVNMGSFTPYRMEIAQYLSWVAGSLTKVRLELGCECSSIEPARGAGGTVTGWVTRLADGTSVRSRYLVVGAGRDAYYPPVLGGLAPGRVIHSTRYRTGIERLPRDRPYRVLVVGSGQSAAEMFRSVLEDLPGCEVTWIMRSIGLRAYETNKFTNELYYPSFVDTFFGARPEGRDQILREMHRTNYSGVAAGLLESLYCELYLDRLAGRSRKRLMTMVDMSGAWEGDGEAVVEVTDRRTGEVTALGVDLVLLGTGFVREMPRMVRALAASLGLERTVVDRAYRLDIGDGSEAACYLQGVNEATHGIADSLLSVLAARAADITGDILAHRARRVAARNGHGDGLAVAAQAEREPIAT
jgi:L-ornithine N5-oxygenase